MARTATTHKAHVRTLNGRNAEWIMWNYASFAYRTELGEYLKVGTLVVEGCHLGTLFRAPDNVWEFISLDGMETWQFKALDLTRIATEIVADELILAAQ